MPCGFVPNLTKLQVSSLHGNPIGKGGAMKALKCLCRYKTPLQELDLAYIGMGEEDCEPLALLIANTNTLQKLDIGWNSHHLFSISVASIMTGLQNSTIQRLGMEYIYFSGNCMSLGSHLERAECQLSWWRGSCGPGCSSYQQPVTNKPMQ